MHTVMLRWVVWFSILLSGLCALTHAADQTITRTVEHFTLGMPKDQAFAVLLSGIKQHQLTLVDQAQTPSPELMEDLEQTPMDAGGQRWITPQSADVLYSLNALLFDAQEFKDPVVNIALSAKVEQSLSWSSPTTQSMYLVLYQRRFPRSEILQQSGMRRRGFSPENRMTCHCKVDRFIVPSESLSKGL
jgi:hypothetical protein